MLVFAVYIISDKGNDLIPGAKACSDASAESGKHQHLVEVCADYLSKEV